VKKITITGGAGFIGSHIVEGFAARYPGAKITVLDKMTYAADVRNIFELMTAGRVRLTVGDICDIETCARAVKGADLVIHAAAESHVDNSFGNSLEFTRTNVWGTHCMMEACRVTKVPKIIHVSTDEVYGEVLEGAVDENAMLKPTNPYSASKAGAEMVVGGYWQSYRLPVITLRANNIYGIRQYPEKIIPRFIMLLTKGEKLTVHGTGKNIRHYLSAIDLAGALDLLVKKGAYGECYNVGTPEEYTNLEVAEMICAELGVKMEDHVEFVNDRPFNDRRYALDWSRITKLGWKPEHSLKKDLPGMVAWYVANMDRYEDVQCVTHGSSPAVDAA
jgi:dTDP-glucose 4,6-dehydratase